MQHTIPGCVDKQRKAKDQRDQGCCDQEQYDAALKLLAEDVTPAFAGLYSDLRGDVLVAQGKNAEARAQYEQALERPGENSAWRDIVQLKLDALSAR